MKVFVIETRRGFVALPVTLAGYSFPLGHGSLNEATKFPFRAAAQKAIKKYHLADAPLHGHIEETELE